MFLEIQNLIIHVDEVIHNILIIQKIQKIYFKMLYQFRYKNKKRYNYEKKKNVIYTWERSNKKEDNYIQNSNNFS
jgi:hypothetical protein